MTDQSISTRMTVLFATGFASLLQLLVMVGLATDRIAVSAVVPILGIVLVFGLLPAMAFMKSRP